MTAAGIPTAAAATCETEAEVSAALDAFGPPYVVKADGLATGKGVVVTPDRREADEHARASGRVVIEEFLDGPEVLSWTGGRPSPWWWPPRVTRARQRPVLRSAAWRMRNGYLAPTCCTPVPHRPRLAAR